MIRTGSTTNKTMARALLLLNLFLSTSSAQVATEWSARYNGAADSVDAGRFIALDPTDGNIYVAGHSWDWNGEYNILTMKYTPAGDTLWTRHYNGPGNNWDVFRSAVVDDGGNVYIAGVTMGVGTFWDIVTLKYNSQGVLQWARLYNNPLANYWDDPHSIAVDTVGNVYVAGKSSATNGLWDFDYVTIKYSPSGDELWVRRYNGVGNFSDVARDVVVDDAGNVYVTGSSAENSSPPYNTHTITIKYDSSGGQVWLADYYHQPGSAAGGAGQHIGLDSDRSVYVSGLSFSTAISQDIATIKYNSAGVQQWVQRYTAPVNSTNEVFDMLVDASGNTFITGYHDFGARAITIKYNTTGQQEWSAQYAGNGNNAGRAIALDDFGNVYITGQAWNPGSNDDYLTIKYDPSGVEQWVQQYNGTAGDRLDYANGIVVDGTGSVYVVGESIGSGTNYDVVAIKYIQPAHVALLSPEHGAMVSADTVVCTWAHSTPAVTQYWFERATDSLFTMNLIVDSTLTDTTLVARNLATNTTYWWRVKAKNAAGWGPFGAPRKFTVVITHVAEATEVPGEFQLMQNYPNPFNPTTEIRYQISEVSNVTLKVYNVLGQEVATLVNEVNQPGRYEVTWNGTGMPSGVYFYRLQSGGKADTKKLVIMR